MTTDSVVSSARSCPMRRSPSRSSPRTIELIGSGRTDSFVVWCGTALTAFLVARQVLALRENWALTRHLEQRVEARTAELHDSRQRFAALVQHSSDVVTVVDREGQILYQSESCLRVLGRTAESMVGQSVWELMYDDQAQLLKAALDSASQQAMRMQTVRNVWRRGDRTDCHLEVTITNLLDNASVAGLVLNSRDVTDRTILEEQLVHQAFHDSLTSLSNRAMFRNRLEHALTRRELKPGRWPCSSSTSTASRRSTTRSVTAAATSFWWRWRCG